MQVGMTARPIVVAMLLWYGVGTFFISSSITAALVMATTTDAGMRSNAAAGIAAGAIGIAAILVAVAALKRIAKQQERAAGDATAPNADADSGRSA